MITAEELERMKGADIRCMEPDSLADIRDVAADMTEPLKIRYPKLMEQLGNPYRFRSGSLKISIGYSDENITLEQALKRCLSAMENP